MGLYIKNAADAQDIANMIEYIVRAEDSSKEQETVGYIKKKFGLSEEQYVLVFELAMPAIRYAAEAKRWATCHNHYKNRAKRYKFLYESLKAENSIDDETLWTLLNDDNESEDGNGI